MSGWDVPKMQPGHQKVRITRVKTEFKGKPMTTKAGVPCIRIVYESEQGGDCENLYMLEGRAIFRLLQVLSACGHKKEDLEKAGAAALPRRRDLPELPDRPRVQRGSDGAREPAERGRAVHRRDSGEAGTGVAGRGDEGGRRVDQRQ